MANNIAYIEKTLPRVVDKVLTQESLTERLFGGNAVKVDFLDARTCKVFKVASTGLTEYARGGHGSSNAEGAVQSSTETFTLQQERYSAIPVDKLDTLDDGGTVLGHLLSSFVAEHVVPEFDAYRFSKLAGYTSVTYGNRVEEVIQADTIISKFNAAFKWMKNQKVKSDNQIIYVSSSVMELIRNTDELNRRLVTGAAPVGVSHSITTYDGREIIEVPEDEFYTDIVIANGFYPSAASKAINFLLVDKAAPIIVNKLDFVKVYDSDNQDLGFVGNKVTSLYYHDLFVPDNKKVGIYASISTAAAAGGALLVNAIAGASGKCKIMDVLTQPAGQIWDKLYQVTTGTAPTIGADAAGTELTLGTDFTPNASHNHIVAAYGGKVVAVSKDFEDELPTGA